MKTLRHILSPIASLIGYVISFALLRLFDNLMIWITRNFPTDYRFEEDSLIMNICIYAVATVAMAIITKLVAPSKHNIHFYVLSGLILIGTIVSPRMEWADIVGTIAGVALGGFYLKTDN